MGFLIRTRTPFDLGEPRAGALQAWRYAEQLVAAYWSAYLEAEGEARPAVFAAYLAALDAEEAAADELARTSLRAAAYPASRAATELTVIATIPVPKT